MEQRERGVPSIFVIPLSQIFLGLLLFVALFYGEHDLTLCALLVLGLAAGAKLWAGISLSGIRCHLSADKQKLFPDERLSVGIHAENHKFLPVWLQVNLPVTGLLPYASPEGILTKEVRLLWYQKTYFQWELTAQRRGVYPIGPCQILAGDLFAFFSKKKKEEESRSIVVYPRLVSLKSFSLPRRDFFGIPGAKSPVQDPIYILGTRDYQHGQPARYVHWKASARHQRLQQKIFEPTEQEKILLVVDVDRFATNRAEEEFERTLEIVASLAVRLDKKGAAVGLLTNGAVVGDGPATVPITKSSSQLPALLEVLARLRMEPQGDAIGMLRQGAVGSWGMSCLLFSYEEGETAAVLKEYFRHHQTPAIFFVWRSGPASEGDRGEAGQGFHRMDEICMKEARGR
ncbi:MAG TPA: DUF58 domain-containing protein [Thermodesulfobacteriota bacterium]|nr:DUF58 domain-containing protein [Thermodesulfobacteriota bacterium]